MNQKSEPDPSDMRPEYDIRGGVRGKYYERYVEGRTVALPRGANEDRRRTAFVIMPFGEGFDEIYNLFIAEAMDEAGYEIYRADDIRSHQNILKDVVTAIFNSDLIVADLTGANPNVYYELGLAHAFRKRVVLLTQQIEDLPFDLRSYRVIPYSTHFAAITKARAQLVALARDLLTSAIPFGSPVTDFLPHAPAGLLSSGSDDILGQSESEGKAGLLDHLVALEEGFQRLGEIGVSVGHETGMLGQTTTEVTQRLEDVMKTGGPARSRRAIVVQFADRLSVYASSLAGHNDDYSKTLTQTRTSLEFLIRSHQLSQDQQRDELRAFVAQMDTLEGEVGSARSSLGTFAETIRSMPRVERTFDQAAEQAIRELDRFEQNLGQTVSMIVRARELAQTRLGD